MSVRGYALLAGLALVLMTTGLALWLLSIPSRYPGDESVAFAAAFGGGVLLVALVFAVAVTLGIVVLHVLAKHYPRNMLEN